MKHLPLALAIFLAGCATPVPDEKAEEDEQGYLVAKSVGEGESDVMIASPPPGKTGDALFGLALLVGAVIAIDALVDDDDDKDDSENPCRELPVVWDKKLGAYVVDTERAKEEDLKKCFEYQKGK